MMPWRQRHHFALQTTEHARPQAIIWTNDDYFIDSYVRHLASMSRLYTYTCSWKNTYIHIPRWRIVMLIPLKRNISTCLFIGHKKGIQMVILTNLIAHHTLYLAVFRYVFNRHIRIYWQGVFQLTTDVKSPAVWDMRRVSRDRFLTLSTVKTAMNKIDI